MLLPSKNNHQKSDRESRYKLSELNLIPVDTFGGRVHVEWDPDAAVTPLGQMAFFIEFLKIAGLFDS